jgi:hypothetical protein
VGQAPARPNGRDRAYDEIRPYTVSLCLNPEFLANRVFMAVWTLQSRSMHLLLG